VLSGEAGKDAACCLLCAADPGCDFWVRDAPPPTDAKSSPHYRVPSGGGANKDQGCCKLRRGFTGYRAAAGQASALPSASEVNARLTCCVLPPRRAVFAKPCPPERRCDLQVPCARIAIVFSRYAPK